MYSQNSFVAVFCALIFSCSDLCTAQTNAGPLLESIFPLSCEPGKSATVTLKGKQLDNVEALIFSIPEVTAVLDSSGKFTVSVPAATRPGDCDVWCIADGHVSNPRRFVISKKTSVSETGGNDTIDAAQSVPFPGAVDGRLESTAKLDWFRFEGATGQSITLSCRSRSLDGAVDPVLALFDPSGREIAHSTGRRRTLLQARLTAAGTYRIRVSDRAYRSAADSFYRLELLTSPQIIATWPDLFQNKNGSKVNLSLYGLNPEGDTETSFSLSGIRSSVQERRIQLPLHSDSLIPAWQSSTEFFEAFIPVQLPTGINSVSGLPRINFTDREVTYEDESATESPTSSQRLTVPALLNGRFNKLNDLDWYSFEAKKDESFLVDVYGDRLGHLMDIDAIITDSTGKTLITFPDAAAPKNLPPVLAQTSLDVTGTWKAPADGIFNLLLRDLYGPSLYGVDRTYALSLRRSQPSFQLIVTPPDEKTPGGYSIPDNARTAVKVSLVRRDGFAAAVRLQLSEENIKAGLVLDETWIGPGESSALAMLSSASDAEVVSPARFLELTASTATEPPLVRQSRPVTLLRTGTATGRFMQRLPVSISAKQPMTVTLSPAKSEIAQGGKLALTLKHTLHNGSLKNDAKIEFPLLPTGMKAPSATIKPGAASTSINLAVPDKLSPGKYSIVAAVAATVISKDQTNTTTTENQAWSNAVTFHVESASEANPSEKEQAEQKP